MITEIVFVTHTNVIDDNTVRIKWPSTDSNKSNKE